MHFGGPDDRATGVHDDVAGAGVGGEGIGGGAVLPGACPVGIDEAF